MATLFTRIVNGEIPCYKIAENESFLAFLDVFPLHLGHTLVIPKKEVDHIIDLDSDEYANLFAFTQPIAKAIFNAIPCKKVGMAVIGLEVPHAHIHLVPIDSVGDINFSKEKLKLSKEDLLEVQEKIKQELHKP
jgi:histidine triad (HIT) family protein